MLGSSLISWCAQKIICQLCHVMEIDVAISLKNTPSTKNAKIIDLGAVKVHGQRCQTLPTCWVTSVMMSLDVERSIFEVIMRLQKKVASWRTNLCVLCYFKCYIHTVKTKLNLINALSAQTLSHPQSIAIWPVTAQLHYTASFWHSGQPGFHETHLELSIDCKSDQETSDNCDRNC